MPYSVRLLESVIGSGSIAAAERSLAAMNSPVADQAYGQKGGPPGSAAPATPNAGGAANASAASGAQTPGSANRPAPSGPATPTPQSAATMSADGPNSPTDGSAQDAQRAILIFFVGGVTHSELAALRFLSERRKLGLPPSFNVLLSATHLLNGTTLLKQFVEDSKGALPGN